MSSAPWRNSTCIELRAAEPGDVVAVANILITAREQFMPYAPSAHTAEQTRGWVRESLLPSGGVTVAEGDGTVLGLIACSDGDVYRWIDQMSVSPALVGCGIGSRLLSHALRDVGKPVRLYTFQANLLARRFYERHHFRAVQFGDGQDNEERCPDALYERAPAGRGGLDGS